VFVLCSALFSNLRGGSSFVEKPTSKVRRPSPLYGFKRLLRDSLFLTAFAPVLWSIGRSKACWKSEIMETGLRHPFRHRNLDAS
jgi:hypothetical protein